MSGGAERPIPSFPAFDRRWDARTLALAALLVLGVLAAYAPALSAGFIWDDDVHFASNPRMSSWSGLWEIWTTRWAVYYPLTSTTFWILRRLVGLNPLAYHLVNVAMHAACALLLWAVLRRLRVPGAWLGAALFALHPVNVESVAWVTELKNTQSLAFLLLSVWHLEKSGLLEDGVLRRHRWYTLSLVLFVAAILSKPSAVMLPPVIVLLLWWRRCLPSWRSLSWTAPFFIASATMGAWTIWEQRYNSGAEGFEWAVAGLDRLVTAGRLLCFYAAKLAWPEPLMFIYPTMRQSADHLAGWMPLVSVAIVCAGLAANMRAWGRPALVASAYYLLMLFPVLGFFNIYFMRYAEAADHFQYLASIGPLALAGAVLARSAEWLRRRWGGAAAGAWFALPAVLLLLILGARSWNHARVFRNNETLWRAAIASNPRAWMAYNNLGLLHQERGEWAQAETAYRAALAINARHYEALCNLGAILMKRGDFRSATSLLEEAIRLRPELPQALVNLGTIHEKVGERAEAKQLFERALHVNPGYSEAHVRLAALAERAGDAVGALAHYRHALAAVTPDPHEHSKFLNQRAAQYIQERRWDDAHAYLVAAQELDPDSSDARQLMAVLQKLQQP